MSVSTQSSWPPSLGYGAESGAELRLDGLVQILSSSSISQGEHTILIVHDRGGRGGDECRLKALGVGLNASFWHVVDTQTLIGEYEDGGKWSLIAMVSRTLGLEPMTSQFELDFGPNSQPVHHNAQDDSFVTLLSFVRIIERWAKYLDVELTTNSSIKLMALDFESSGSLTTEIGLSIIDMGHLKNTDWKRSIKTHHVILSENKHKHPSRAAQRGRMLLDSFKEDTYPRWNTRTGPNGTAKVKVKCGRHFHLMSPDSVFMSEVKIKVWLLEIMKAKASIPETSPSTQNTDPAGGSHDADTQDTTDVDLEAMNKLSIQDTPDGSDSDASTLSAEVKW